MLTTELHIHEPQFIFFIFKKGRKKSVHKWNDFGEDETNKSTVEKLRVCRAETPNQIEQHKDKITVHIHIYNT